MTNMTLGVAGRYKMEAVNADTGERRVVADWFDNLITDMGLNRLGSGGVCSYCLVGSGSTPPANSDTQLQTLVAATSTTQGGDGGIVTSPTAYRWARYVFRFGAGAAAGNLSEVGVNWNGSTTAIFSRALIKDGSGNPTTITILSNEYLDVTYELRVYPPAADVTFQRTISGQTYDCTLRAMGIGLTSPQNYLSSGASYTNSGYVNAYSGAIGSITGFPGGSQGGLNYTQDAYSNNSYAQTCVLTAGLSVGNFGAGGIQAIGFQNHLCSFQVGFSPAIPKDGTKILTLNVSVSWARRTA
jgi:hypothetical protein